MYKVKFALLTALIVLLVSNNSEATRRARIVVDNPDNFISISLTLGKKEVACYVDKKGKIVIKPKYEKALSFTDGLGNVKVGDRWMYIDKSGKFALEQSFDEEQYFRDGFIVMERREGGNCIPEPEMPPAGR